jgi:hypothetical protein
MLILAILAVVTLGIIGVNTYLTAIRDIDRALASLRADQGDEPAVSNPNQEPQ